MKILIIDDDRRLLKALARLLAPNEVVTATTCQGAVAAAYSERPDAIFCDLILGEQNGLDCIVELAAIAPVVAMTHSPSGALLDMAIALGAKLAIQKDRITEALPCLEALVLADERCSSRLLSSSLLRLLA